MLELSVDELELGYRTSCIPGRGYTVLEASFQLEPGDGAAIEARDEGTGSQTGGRNSPWNIPAQAAPSNVPRDILQASS